MIDFAHAAFFFARAGLVVVFVTAAVSKGSSGDRLREFSDSLGDLAPRAFRTKRRRILGATALALLEMATAILLVVPPASLAGLASALVLLVSFSAAIASVVRRGVSASCRCFGAEGAPLSASHLVRNGGLGALAAAGIIVGLLTAPLPAIPDYEASLGIALGFVVGVAMTRWDDLAFIASPSASSHETPAYEAQQS